MSTKRRKIAHDSGTLKDDSIEITKAKLKSKSAPKAKVASPTQSSDAESSTVDDTSKQENGDAAPKSFADLVRGGFAHLTPWRAY